MNELRNLIRAEILDDNAADPGPLIRHVLDKSHNQDGISSILLYGSGLWKNSGQDTVWDFHVLVDNYADFTQKKWHRLAGFLLSPNVYYFELPSRNLRCKCNVMRLDQFQKQAAGKCISPHIWARFAQPCRLIYSRSHTDCEHVTEALADCVTTFYKFARNLDRASLSQGGDIWVNGLKKTYSLELRSERPERARLIYETSQDSFERRNLALLKSEYGQKAQNTPTPRYGPLKTCLVKAIGFLRLLKSATTFEGGVDYALWKVHRHSGIRIEPSEFQRKHPLIAGWPILWKLWRKGALK